MAHRLSPGRTVCAIVFALVSFPATSCTPFLVGAAFWVGAASAVAAASTWPASTAGPVDACEGATVACTVRGAAAKSRAAMAIRPRAAAWGRPRPGSLGASTWRSLAAASRSRLSVMKPQPAQTMTLHSPRTRVPSSGARSASLIPSRVGVVLGIGFAPMARSTAGNPMMMPSTATVPRSPASRWRSVSLIISRCLPRSG